MKRIILFVLLASACATHTPTSPYPIKGRDAEFTATCTFLWQQELGRTIDSSGLAACVHAAQYGATAESIVAGLRMSEEYAEYQRALANATLRPRESGWLSLDGQNHLVTAEGRKWRGVGASDFLLLKRFIDGEDIKPVLAQRQALGFNYLRVFGMFDGALGILRPQHLTWYWDQLDTFLSLVATYGMRVEYVVFADAQRVMPNVQEQRDHLQAASHVLNQHWNAMGELANEYLQNGVNPGEFARPAGLTLWSRGSNCCGDDGYFNPPWDYITHHAARDDQWPRKSECRPIRDFSGRDCLEDEPIGASETNKPGSRSNNSVDFGQAGINFGIVTSGGLFHSDSGIMSQLFGSVEIALAKSFVAGLTFAPVEAITAPYQRGNNCGDCDGIGGMPLQQLDQFELRIFCKLAGGKEWCADIRHTRAPIARAGWCIEDHAIEGVIRLGRCLPSE